MAEGGWHCHHAVQPQWSQWPSFVDRFQGSEAPGVPPQKHVWISDLCCVNRIQWLLTPVHDGQDNTGCSLRPIGAMKNLCPLARAHLASVLMPPASVPLPLSPKAQHLWGFCLTLVVLDLLPGKNSLLPVCSAQCLSCVWDLNSKHTLNFCSIYLELPFTFLWM
jgi:hypothetical protein